MAKKAELKAVLKLDNMHFARAIKHSIALARDLARQLARQPIRTTFLAGILAAHRGVKVTGGAIEKLGSVSTKAFKLGLVGAAALKASLIGLSAYSIHVAADLETLTNTFGVLLGSTEKGAKRMRELLQFANDRGLQLTTVAEASRTLETLTRGALSTGKGLEFVGNLAAGTNVEFNRMAIIVGRVYDALRSGTAAGEELSRLQDLGAITGTQRRRIEGLNAIQRGAEGWKVLQGALAKFDGMLKVRSKSWEGMWERFKDSIQEAGRQFGTPLMEGLKPTLDAITNQIFGLDHKFKELGKDFAEGLKTGINFFIGAFANPSAFVTPFVESMKAGILQIGNIFAATLKAAVSVVVSGSFFSSMVTGWIGLCQVISGQLLLAFQGPVAYFLSAIEKGIEMITSLPKRMVNAPEMLKDRLEIDGMIERLEGMKPGTPEHRALNAKINTRLEARREMLEGKGIDNRSISERAHELMGSGLLGRAAKETISEGEEKMKQGVDGFFGSIKDAIDKFEIKDIFGAGEALNRAKDSIKATALIGQSLAASIPRPILDPGSSGASGSGQNARRTLWGGMRLFRTMLDAEPRRVNSLLRFRERVALENRRVSAIQGAAGDNIDVRRGSGRGFHVVRSGDRKRMQEAMRERLREKEGLDKTNGILEAIQVKFDAFVKG